MDSFNSDDYIVKMGEANAKARDNRLRSMGKAFRTIELCIALFFLLWVMLRLPFAVRIFCELLRRLLLLLLATPFTISVLFGFCVAAVMVKSYRVSTQNIAEDNDGTNFYKNIVRDFHETVAFQHHHHHHHMQEVEDVKTKNMPLYEDKEIVMSCEYGCDKPKTPSAATFDIPNDSDSYMGNELDQLGKVEVTGTVEEESMEPDVVLEKQYYSNPRDRLNDSDFKKTIEAFIKRQHEFLKLENRCEYYGEADAYVYCY